MRVVVLEDYLNYASNAPCLQPLRERCEVIVYDKEDGIAKVSGTRDPLPPPRPATSRPSGQDTATV
jgi:hypothetical protein